MTDVQVPKDFHRRLSFAAVVPIDQVKGKVSQSADCVMLVTPKFFTRNADAAEDNKFMPTTLTKHQEEIMREAAEQHERFVAKLREAGVEVVLLEAHDPEAPDACFPNNWFTTHPESEVGARACVLYPMHAPSRRRERRPSIINQLKERYPRVVDLSYNEDRPDTPHYLEGTGVLVLDRVHRVAYAALSARCDEELARDWTDAFKYELCAFHTRMSETDDSPIYHTNVMMSIGSTIAVVCLEVVHDPEERKALYESLSRFHEVCEITKDQMAHFCANILEVRAKDGSSVMVMSTTAYEALRPDQIEQMKKHVSKIVHSDVSVIETIGGGGVRCMMAELF